MAGMSTRISSCKTSPRHLSCFLPLPCGTQGSDWPQPCSSCARLGSILPAPLPYNLRLPWPRGQKSSRTAPGLGATPATPSCFTDPQRFALCLVDIYPSSKALTNISTLVGDRACWKVVQKSQESGSCLCLCSLNWGQNPLTPERCSAQGPNPAPGSMAESKS